MIESEILTLIEARLEELRPIVEEANKLEKAIEALSTVEGLTGLPATAPKESLEPDILRHLIGSGPLKSTELAEKMDRPYGSVNRACNRMAQKGKLRQNRISRRWEPV